MMSAIRIERERAPAFVSDTEWYSEPRVSVKDKVNESRLTFPSESEQSETTLSMSPESSAEFPGIVSEPCIKDNRDERNGSTCSPSDAIFPSIDAKVDHWSHRNIAPHQSSLKDPTKFLAALSVGNVKENHPIDAGFRNGRFCASEKLSTPLCQPSICERSPVQGNREDLTSSISAKSTGSAANTIPRKQVRSISRSLSSVAETNKRDMPLDGQWNKDHSATTVTNTMADSPRKRLGRRTVSAVDYCFSNPDSNRDLCPRAPQRRILERSESARSTTTSSIGSGSRTTSMSSKELSSHVMAQIPQDVFKQLPQDQWERIFSVLSDSSVNEPPSNAEPEPQNALGGAVHKAGSMNKDVKESVGQTDDEDEISITCSLVSAFTSSVSSEISQTREKGRSTVEGFLPTLPVRSWEGGTSKNEGAPKIPSRARFGDYRQASQPTLMHHGRTDRVTPARRYSTTMLAGSTGKDPFRKVQFAKVHVRYHERILDVNPSTSSGPSVGLGWQYEDEPVTLDLRFHFHDNVTNTREIILSRAAREEMLSGLGYYKADLAKAIRLNLKLKNQRSQTYNNLKHERVEYLIETSKRKVSKLLRFRGPVARQRNQYTDDDWSTNSSKHSTSS